MSKKYELTSTSESARIRRAVLDQDQRSFWTRLGVTQSAGSRYESGRGVHKPLAILFALVHTLDDKGAHAALDLLRNQEVATATALSSVLGNPPSPGSRRNVKEAIKMGTSKKAPAKTPAKPAKKVPAKKK